MLTGRQKFLLDLAGVLDTDVSHFQDPETGLLFAGFRQIISLRMQQLAIYSESDLQQRLGSPDGDNLYRKIKDLDRKSAQEQNDYREYRRARRRAKENEEQ